MSERMAASRHAAIAPPRHPARGRPKQFSRQVSRSRVDVSVRSSQNTGFSTRTNGNSPLTAGGSSGMVAHGRDAPDSS